MVQAVDRAITNQKPARLLGGVGVEPGFASNRRRSGWSGGYGHSCSDGSRVLQGSTIAILVSYACHPVVLGADNLSWTGDYPHFVREELENALPWSNCDICNRMRRRCEHRPFGCRLAFPSGDA